ncbi:type II toxin-antitoxin system RelE/ParE family toxin [Leifsonia sp. fls2-241-R2A-40a]|uniref:type II toxin-antitoxin system RelE/ParE family toxin n=1 Tax=Leifsonia sp. fls2-241-R2A-40a TaxID=3040290 RepID=UPI00254E7AF7|nr:type II toxin-antitoxin system RelE/ParE family toxin [Leifsonia sp. fls2-241-R2A-40a]
MELKYASRDLERICTDERRMYRVLSAPVAKALKLRIAEIRRVREYEDLLLGTGRWEQLRGDRAGQWSARLTANWRLIIAETESDEVVALLIEIVDYH